MACGVAADSAVSTMKSSVLWGTVWLPVVVGDPDRQDAAEGSGRPAHDRVRTFCALDFPGAVSSGLAALLTRARPRRTREWSRRRRREALPGVPNRGGSMPGVQTERRRV